MYEAMLQRLGVKVAGQDAELVSKVQSSFTSISDASQVVDLFLKAKEKGLTREAFQALRRSVDECDLLDTENPEKSTLKSAILKRHCDSVLGE
jgi:hypothetical protein